MPFAQPLYLVDGARTPFLKARGGPGPFSAADLATQAGRALLLRQPFPADALDEVILGCAAPAPDETNIGRLVAQRLGCGHRVPGWTVMRNCASGMQAIDCAAGEILRGRSQLVLAGGVDALSRSPLLYAPSLVRWFAALAGMKTPAQKIAHFLRLRPAAFFAPVVGLLQGLTDPVLGLLMGQTAENLAARFAIGRREMDAYALESHQRALAARAAGHFGEIVPLIDGDGKIWPDDDGVRADSSLEALARQKPFFDKPHGRVTAANSSQVSDGAAWLLLASEAAVRRWNLRPLGRLLDSRWVGLDPAVMGLGPVHGVPPLLRDNGLDAADVDAWEINEAFAAQVLACFAAWQDADFCRRELGLQAAFGAPPQERVNVDGGAIAIGHPVGASGVRIVLHLLHVLRRQGGRRGVASLCIGGGQGAAILVEALP